MEFIVEEIEVKTDLDPRPDKQCCTLKNDVWENSRDSHENMVASDPYFKFKLLVDELLVIFTKCEEKCGICVESIVKLCQHIGDTHDNGHEHETHATVSTRSVNSEDDSTQSNASTATTSINTTGAQNVSQDIGYDDMEQNKNVVVSSENVKSRTNFEHVNTTNSTAKNKKARVDKLVSVDRRLLTGEKRFKCETCGKCFTRNLALKEHNRIHTGEMPYECHICGKLFRYVKGLRIHKQRVKCKRNQSMKNKRRLTIKFHKCLKCSKIFNSKSALNAHSTEHTIENSLYCGVCGKGFLYKYLLVRHTSTHTGKKEYRCGVCGKGFPYNCLLMKHRLSHKRERRFNCNMCDKIFFRKDHLGRHKLTHAGGKQFHCNLCGKNISRKDQLDKHKLTHTEEKQIQCYGCRIYFRNMRDFRAHKLGNKCRKEESLGIN